jgi:hypothetical protein
MDTIRIDHFLSDAPSTYTASLMAGLLSAHVPESIQGIPINITTHLVASSPPLQAGSVYIYTGVEPPTACGPQLYTPVADPASPCTFLSRHPLVLVPPAHCPELPVLNVPCPHLPAFSILFFYSLVLALGALFHILSTLRFIVRHARTSLTIKMSQPFLCKVFLGSSALCVAIVILLSIGEATQQLCVARFYCFSILLTASYTALNLKLYRICRMYNLKWARKGVGVRGLLSGGVVRGPPKRVVFTNEGVLKAGCYVVATDALVCGFIHVFGGMDLNKQVDNYGGIEVESKVCGGGDWWVYVLLAVWKSVLCAWSVVLARASNGKLLRSIVDLGQLLFSAALTPLFVLSSFSSPSPSPSPSPSLLLLFTNRSPHPRAL